MITDLERIGDHATDIAEILETGSIKVPAKDIDLAKMAEIAKDMINHSVESYVQKDLEMAREVIDGMTYWMSCLSMYARRSADVRQRKSIQTTRPWIF